MCFEAEIITSVCVLTELHSSDVNIKQLLPADLQQLMVNVKTAAQMAHSILFLLILKTKDGEKVYMRSPYPTDSFLVQDFQGSCSYYSEYC
jgi:hypothetical protein